MAKLADSKKTTLWICITAAFTGLTVALSSFSIPVPGGHLYLCDIAICTAAMILDPIAAFIVGGVGSFIGDFLFYPTPMFVSLISHGLQAIIISLLSHNTFKKKPIIGSILGVTLGGIIMIVGYSLGRAFIYSTVEYAILKLPFEILQATIGAVIALILCYSFKLPYKLKKIIK